MTAHLCAPYYNGVLYRQLLECMEAAAHLRALEVLSYVTNILSPQACPDNV